MSTLSAQELRDFAAQNKLVVSGTGKNGAVIKVDLLKAYNEFQKTNNSDKKVEKPDVGKILKSCKQEQPDVDKMFKSIDGQKQLYELGLVDFEVKLNKLVKSTLNPKNKATPEQIKYVLGECKWFKHHGSQKYDEYIEALKKMMSTKP